MMSTSHIYIQTKYFLKYSLETLKRVCCKKKQNQLVLGEKTINVKSRKIFPQSHYRFNKNMLVLIFLMEVLLIITVILVIMLDLLMVTRCRLERDWAPILVTEAAPGWVAGNMGRRTMMIGMMIVVMILVMIGMMTMAWHLEEQSTGGNIWMCLGAKG